MTCMYNTVYSTIQIPLKGCLLSLELNKGSVCAKCDNYIIYRKLVNVDCRFAMQNTNFRGKYTCNFVKLIIIIDDFMIGYVISIVLCLLSQSIIIFIITKMFW